jgi:hypothetical protein
MAESFQYAILRAIPSLPRGEAVNVGVVVHCRRASFLGVRARVDPERLLALAPEADVDGLAEHLALLGRVAEGDPGAGDVARLDRSDRFGWIVAPSSTVVQPSPVHTGLTDDPGATLDRLFAELVATPGR